MNVKEWKDKVIASTVKKAMPILSFPCVQLMNISVKELINDSALQAQGMKIISEKADTLASPGMMDLSVEAESFGARVHVSDDEVPTVTGRILFNEDDVRNLQVPSVQTGRTGLYINAIKKAVQEIKDRPVLAGVIGPFSLAGRLMDMTEIMANCYDEPEMVKATLEKTSAFITEYILAFKAAGANGVIMAEPAAGLLSPNLVEEFSCDYIKKIVARIKDDEFMFVYHNCGPNTPLMLPALAGIGADAYSFGDAIKLKDVLEKMPSDVLVLGNISPARQFRGGTPESVYAATTELLQECSKYKNFVISSGCDIPPMSSWKNIDSFFKAVKDFYG